jgi:hypothetical protein
LKECILYFHFVDAQILQLHSLGQISLTFALYSLTIGE